MPAPGTSGKMPDTRNIVIGHFILTVSILEMSTTISAPRNAATAEDVYRPDRAKTSQPAVPVIPQLR